MKNTNLINYYPEMGHAKHVTDFEADHYNIGSESYWFIKTPKVLSGRGVKRLSVLQADNLTEAAQYKAGWNYYRLTQAAFEKIQSAHTISIQSYL